MLIYIFWSHKRTVQFTVLYGGHLSYSCWSSCRNITPWMLVYTNDDVYAGIRDEVCLGDDVWWRGSDSMRCQPVTNSSSLSSGGATDYTQFPLLGWTALDVNRLSLRCYFPFRMSCSTANYFPLRYSQERFSQTSIPKSCNQNLNQRDEFSVYIFLTMKS
jgi:hypothetical protein